MIISPQEIENFEMCLQEPNCLVEIFQSEISLEMLKAASVAQIEVVTMRYRSVLPHDALTTEVEEQLRLAFRQVGWNLKFEIHPTKRSWFQFEAEPC